MTSASSLFRSLLLYSLCVPLAVFVGYVVGMPADRATFATLGLLFFFLASPLVLRWHRLWLVATWNMTAVLFFVPGRPALWLVLVWVSFLIAVLQYILNPKLKFISV